MTNENDEDFAYISVDYDDGKPETFRGYILEYKDTRKTFLTDEEAVDYAESLGAFYFHTQSVDDYEEEQRTAKARI